jgi:polar amino acid transport system permease protein
MDNPSTDALSGPPVSESPHVDFRAVPLRHPLRWLATAVIGVLVAMAVHFAVTNPRWRWHVVWHYLFSRPVLEGLGRTLLLTASAMTLGLVAGTLLAVMRLSPNPVVAWTSRIYVWAFRGIPPLVLLLFIYFLSELLPELSIGVPFGPEFATEPTNKLITQFTAATIGLGLAEAAYISEIVRGGILSVSVGQTRAALALGMTPARVTRSIILPQALRVALPPLGNQVISMFKATSLTSVIAYSELLTTVQVIYARNFEQIPLLLVACIWYGVLTTVATLGQSRLETHLARTKSRREASR